MLSDSMQGGVACNAVIEILPGGNTSCRAVVQLVGMSESMRGCKAYSTITDVLPDKVSSCRAVIRTDVLFGWPMSCLAGVIP